MEIPLARHALVPGPRPQVRDKGVERIEVRDVARALLAHFDRVNVALPHRGRARYTV